MEKLFKVTVAKVDPETKEETEVVLDDVYASIALVAKCEDDRCAEVIMNDTIFGIAAKLASCGKMKAAVRLANALMEMKKDDAENAETALLRALMGE